MPTTSPLETVNTIYAAFTTNDLDALLSLCAPDTVITQDPALPWGGAFRGPEGATEFVMKLVGTIDSVVTPEVMFVAGHDVVQIGRTAGTVRSNGAAFDISECHVWTVRDGLVTRARFYIDSTAMLEALSA
jgi:ketosteroid isomerase-like protein